MNTRLPMDTGFTTVRIKRHAWKRLRIELVRRNLTWTDFIEDIHKNFKEVAEVIEKSDR
jgi:hypothetical protein